ncbi:tetratricopeptide repeat protein [Acidobacteriota bacterium]
MRGRLLTKMNGMRIKRFVLFITRKWTFLIIIAFCLFFYSCSKEPAIDLIGMDKEELEELLGKTPDSALKVDILNELAYRYSWDGGQRPRDYAEKAKRLSEKLDYDRGFVDALNNMAQIYFMNGDFDESKKSCEEGLAKATKIKYRTGIAMATNGIARYYQLSGEYKLALQNFQESEEICKNSSTKIDKRVLARAYYGLGALHYYDPVDYQEAKKYFEKHLELGKEIRDNIIISSGFYAIGEMHRGLGKFTEAKEKFEKCFTSSERIGLIYNKANAYEGLGDLYVDLGDIYYSPRFSSSGLGDFYLASLYRYIDLSHWHTVLRDIYYGLLSNYFESGYWSFLIDEYDKAFVYYNKSHELFLKTGNKFQVAESKRRLGKLYNKMGDKNRNIGNYRKAFEYLLEALTIAKKAKIPKTIERICEEIAESCVKLGDYRDASSYYRIMFEKKKFLRENEMSKLKLIRESEKKAERERITKFSLIKGFVGLSIALIILLVILFKLRKKKKELENSHENVERLSEIGQVITSSLSANDIIDRVYENVNKLMDAQGFYIGILDEKEQCLNLSGRKEYGEEIPFHFNDLSEKNRLSVHCFENELEIRIGDYEKEYLEYISEKLPPKEGRDFNSHIFLPLVLIDKQGGKKKIGVICVQSDKKNAYSDYHYNILKNLAIHVAIALDNANAYSKIEEQKLKIQDQTERLAAALENEIEMSDLKDDLMHTVAHQYKTPLSIIHSSTQILKDYLIKLSRREISGHLKIILSNTEDMTHLIDQLLRFGRKFSPSYCDMGAIFVKSIDEIESNEGKNHKIVFNSSGDTCKAKVDRDFINIIVRNLVANSIKYSDQGSTINVELKCSKNDAVINVSDQRIGIPEDSLKIIFERFQRGSNVKMVQGTGLGLAIVKRYTEMHGGEVLMNSELNKGTTVTVRIPKEPKS